MLSRGLFIRRLLAGIGADDGCKSPAFDEIADCRISPAEIYAYDVLAAYRDANPKLSSPAQLHWRLGHVGDITAAQVLQRAA